MKTSFRLYFLVVVATFSVPVCLPAAVIFKKGEHAKFIEPGSEEMNGNAQELFNKGQEYEKRGDLKSAIKAYRTVSRRYPKDALAGGSVFKMAELEEKRHDYLTAAATYKLVVLRYPRFERFDDAIEAQFRIGEMYLAGKKVKLLGVPLRGATDDAINIFAAIVGTAPYGKYTARAQFDIGRAREKQGASDSAVLAYQAVVEKFPNDPIAADAQYQIGYLWMKATKQGTNDASASKNAKEGFQDFLYRHPASEKTAQAKQNLAALEHKQTADAFQIAKFYDKQKNYRAAVIYYNDVVRQQPGSRESDHAQKRIAELRKKVGEKALQPIELTNATTKKKTSPMASSGSQMRGSPNDVAPLPPPEADTSLPPPASMTPDTTSAPFSDTSLQPAAATSSGASGAPEPSASPQP